MVLPVLNPKSRDLRTKFALPLINCVTSNILFKKARPHFQHIYSKHMGCMIILLQDYLEKIVELNGFLNTLCVYQGLYLD